MATSTPPLTPSKPPGSAFPQKAALAALTATALLYAWHRLKDPTAGLATGIFRDAATLHVPHAPTPVSPTAPFNGIQQPAEQTQAIKATKPNTPTPISAVFVDDSHALDPFFASLYNLETHRKPEVVTILHYGDSPTTADLITGDARALLQQRFGDAGPGFNLIAKPWAWYGHRGITVSDHGWKSLTGVGSMRQSTYGLGGATLVGGPDATSTLKLSAHDLTAADLQFLTEPNGGSVTLTADGNPLATISTASPADTPPDTPKDRLIPLPPGTASLSLSVSGGQAKLAGIDLRRGNSGVLYDSLGLNGASTTVISRTFSPTAWAAELQHAAPSLVVINYGTNESTFASFVNKQYEPELRLAIAKLRSALPDVSILIMSPMDRGERGGLNEIHTMATIPEIIAIQKRVAADLHCGFFDTFDAMGGDGTMSRWTAAKPRLVTADLIHPTPQGALIVAQQLISNLDLGYNRWKQTHGHGTTNLTGPTGPGHPLPGLPAAATQPSSVIPTGATRSGGTRLSPSTDAQSKNAVVSTGTQTGVPSERSALNGVERSGETPVSRHSDNQDAAPQHPSSTLPPPRKPSAATPEPPPPSPTSADPSNSSDTGGR